MLDGSDAERRDLAPQGVELRKALAELRLGGVLPDGPPHLGRYDADCFVLRWPGWEGFVRHGIDGVFSLAFHERGYMCDGRIELSRHDGETYQSVGHYGTLMLACIDRIDQLDDGSLSDTRRYVDGVLWTKPQSGFINASQALGLVQQIESVAAASCAPFLRVGTRDFWVARHMADRGASIRMPHSFVNNGYRGYLEDRRPNSQGDPYKIASRILQTIATVPTK
jgi:hypothetical protein